MAFLDVNTHQEQHTFDWNDITVGNIQLDHSQNFFERKHYEHERLGEMEFLQQKMSKTEISHSANDEGLCDNKENIGSKCISPDDRRNKIKMSKTLCPGSSKLNEGREASPVDAVEETQVRQDPSGKVAANLACEWSTKKPICSQAMTTKGALSKSVLPPPHAYLIKDIYKRKREEAERRRIEEERKLREFHSRPAPKFIHHHEQLQKREAVHAVTVAITPQVLKKSRETEEKRRKKLEEWKSKNHPPKFSSRPPTVLKEKPFVPEKKPVVVEQCPFNLHMEKRLQERKQYNAQKQKALEEKRKQVEIEEEERKRLEEERIKELRKAAVFKARPNPFKN